MRKQWIGISLVLVGSMAAALPCKAAEVNAHAAFVYGHKDMDSEDWEPADGQTAWGAVTAITKEGWPVHFALDVLEADDDGAFEVPFAGVFQREASSREIALGVRKFWRGNGAFGYVGTGLAMISVESKYTDASGSLQAEEDANGPWLGGGVLWRFGGHFEVGIDLRWSDASVDLDYGGGIVDSAVDVGGIHAGVMFGLGWGS